MIAATDVKLRGNSVADSRTVDHAVNIDNNDQNVGYRNIDITAASKSDVSFFKSFLHHFSSLLMETAFVGVDDNDNDSDVECKFPLLRAIKLK